jgi:Flp pilus assembly protein TadD
MTAPAPKARRAALVLLAGASLLPAAPALAQQPRYPSGAVVQPLPDAGRGAELRGHLRTLADNPRSLAALVGAGRAAVALGDYQAALTFFTRAREIAPGDARVLAGMGSVLIHMEQPQDALRYFAEAAAAGAPAGEIAGDRGLAHDALGDQARAQADYNLALRTREDPEVRRRLALSLAISGHREPALRAIADQLARRDRAALRVQAFVLALTGDAAGAAQTARSAMPGAAGALTPFLARLPSLTPAQRAMAVHFGRFPTGGPVQMAGTPGARPYTPPPAAATPRPQAQAQERRSQPQERGSPLVSTPQPGARQPVEQPARTSESRVRQRQPVDVFDRFARSQPNTPAPRRREPNAAQQPQQQQPNTGQPVTQPPPERRATPEPARQPEQQPQQPVRIAQAPPQPAPQPNPVQGPPQERTQVPQPEAGPQQSAQPARAGSPAPVPPQPGFSAPAAEPPPAAPAEPAPAVVPGAQPSQQPAELAQVESPAGPAQPVQAPPQAQQGASRPGFDEVAALVSRLPTEEPTAPARAQAAPPQTQVARPQQQTTRPQPPANAQPQAARPQPQTARPTQRAERPATTPPARTERPAAAGTRERTAAATPAPQRGTAQQPVREAHPSRHWVQVAGGADRSALPQTFARLREQAPVLLRNRAAYATVLRATNRLLVGPFPSIEAAQDFVNQLARQNLTAFTWTSPAGQEVERLPAR